jgi:hypothetical protein
MPLDIFAFFAVTRHPEKRNVVAVEEIPFFPDFDLWRNQYASKPCSQ